MKEIHYDNKYDLVPVYGMDVGGYIVLKERTNNIKIGGFMVNLGDEVRDAVSGFNEMITKKPHPIEAIKFRMEQQNISAIDLVRAGCGDRSHISEMLNKKRKITLRFIRNYHKICSTTPLEVLIQDYKIKKRRKK